MIPGPARLEVSLAVGERVLLPAVREAPPSTTVLADGFSWGTQITEATGRPAWHLAQLLAAGLPKGGHRQRVQR